MGKVIQFRKSWYRFMYPWWEMGYLAGNPAYYANGWATLEEYRAGVSVMK